MRSIVRFVLRLWGWEIIEMPPHNIAKAVVVMAPHTSNWDFVIGRLAFFLMRIKGRFLIKKELFFFPLNIVLRALGALPVDRGQANNMISTSVNLFNKHEHLYLVFTPEGTRSANGKWKKGFFYIAKEAKVPIVLAYIDYANKKGGFHGVFSSTGDVSTDIQEIKKQLADYKGKYAENGIIF
ncbi:MAG: acyltransferase [Flavobacteriales bacterium]|nr:acyltransferase [Flavobacteriales bacterium]